MALGRPRVELAQVPARGKKLVRLCRPPRGTPFRPPVGGGSDRPTAAREGHDRASMMPFNTTAKGTHHSAACRASDESGVDAS